jgi:hypothetical protein
MTLQTEDLEAVALLYDQIREYRRDREHDIDSQLATDFDNHVKKIMDELNIVLTPNNNTHNIQMHIIKTKIGLYDICFEKITEHFSDKDRQL